MENSRKFVVPAIAVMLLGLGAGVLFAQQAGPTATQQNKDMVKAMTEHKMTLTKAIDAAEQYVQGQALSAAVHMRGNDVVVSVTCLVGDNVKHVTVDVATGKVADSATAQKAMTRSPTHNKPRQPSKKP